jgi:biopolymer transport protein ExbB/TolQ
MVMNIPGSEILTSTLNVISQSLLIPVIILLLLFVIYAIITLGGLISEYSSRKKVPVSVIKNLIHDISLAENEEIAKETISSSIIPDTQKTDLLELLSSRLSKESSEALARKFIENEENIIDKVLEKTDIMARIGPTLGLMGTLIPMGPGLAALGSGDINTLANAIVVAFDTTVVGIGAGAVGYFVSKIRKRWYDEYLSNLDALSDAVLDFMKRNR